MWPDSPLEADDLHVFEIIIHAEKPIDRQQLMHGLMELLNQNINLILPCRLMIYFGATNV